MISKVAVHWAIADRLGGGSSLFGRQLSDGCRMKTEFEDWTKRS